MKGNLLHEDITRLIIGAGMDVYNSVGPGWNEWDYHRAMMVALANKGLRAVSHLRGSLMHRNQCVDRFELDIIIEDKVVLELKHIRTDFAPEHYTQLISYLKFWEKDLGMLMNFGADHFHFRRVPYTPKTSKLETAGKYEELKSKCPRAMEVVLAACSYILDSYGLGYSRNTCEKLVRCEMQFQGLDVRNAVVGLQYEETDLGERESDCLLVDSGFVVRTSAMLDSTSSVDLARVQSCMKQLKIERGLLINFGKQVLLLRGVCIWKVIRCFLLIRC